MYIVVYDEVVCTFRFRKILVISTAIVVYLGQICILQAHDIEARLLPLLALIENRRYYRPEPMGYLEVEERNLLRQNKSITSQ